MYINELAIVVPYYGEGLSEIISKIKNLRSTVPGARYCIHIDRELSDIEIATISEFDAVDTCITWSSNQGLTHARYEAIKNAIEAFIPKYIMLSNSDDLFYRKLDRELLYEVDDHYLVMFTTLNSRVSTRSVDYSEFINGRYGDMIPMIRVVPNLLELYPRIIGEKYYPEVSLFHKIASLDPNHPNQCKIIDNPLCRIEYGSGGMTNSYSRKSVISNRRGYYENARYLLDQYLYNDLPLTITKVKNLVDDLVTCGDSVPLKEFKGTYIEPLLISRLMSWTQNENHNHLVKFIESE